MSMALNTLTGQGIHAGRPCCRRLGVEALAARALLHGAARAAGGKGRSDLRAAGREERRAEYAGQGPQSGQRRPESDTGSGHVPPDCTAPGAAGEPRTPRRPSDADPARGAGGCPRAASGHRGERAGETEGTKSLWKEGELWK